MDFLELADDGEDQLVTAIEDLSLVVLVDANTKRLESFAAWSVEYIRAFQLETRAMAVEPSCSYTLMFRSMTLRREATVRPLSRS
jgi:hypothetical protein